MIEAIRSAAAPLLGALPAVAWLPHKLVRKANGKLDKPPCEGSDTASPGTWFTLDKALERLAGKTEVAGIGFAITEGIIALDYDDCRNEITGELNAEVAMEMEHCNSYAYVTPSQKGIRIVGTNDARIPGGKKVRYLPGGQKVEIFIGPTNHYNTFTADQIDGYATLRDISDNVIDYLQNLYGANGSVNGFDKAPPVSNPDASRSIGAIRAALHQIPNPSRNWDEWSRIGMATWRSSGGSPDGFEAWCKWSAKLSEIHDEAACEERWSHWGRSPPTKLGFGTLYYEARRINPLFVPPFDETTYHKPEENRSEYKEEPAKQTPLPLTYFIDIHANLDAADFVEGLLIEGSMAVIYGESNCGKTFFATDLGLHIAMGKKWRGRDIELGGVIYCALEGSHGISNRIAAFRNYYGLGKLELPFAIIPCTINMLDPAADTDRLIETINIAAKEMCIPVRLVVVDTLSRALVGGNENAPDDMGALVTNTDKVRQATKAAVTYVHHSGKDAAKGARGHSLLRAATDTEIEIVRENPDSPSTATVMKQREMEIEGEFSFKLQSVQLGENRRGKPVTSCVVVDSETPPAFGEGSVKAEKLPSNASLGMRALMAALTRSAVKLPNLPDYPGNTWAAASAVWREEFYQLKSGTPDTKKHAFSTAETVLLARDLITQRNGMVWLTKPISFVKPPEQEAGQ